MKFLFKKRSSRFYYFLIFSFFCSFIGFSFVVAESQGKTAKKAGIELTELNHKAEGANRKSYGEKQKKPDKLQYSVPGDIEREREWQARGVIIKFRHWPDSTQQKEIVERLQTGGLKKTRSVRRFKTWLFEWSEGGLKPSRMGERACKKLKGLSSVKRCNPDHLLPLNRSSGFLKTRLQTETPSYLFENFRLVAVTVVREDEDTETETEAGFVEDCPSCREQSGIPKLPLNIKTCNVISYKRELMEGKLSDHWAQELIGSDLLRAELKQTPPPKRPNWIAVFDTQRRGHSLGVTHLISDEEFHDKDFHGVLPALGSEETSFFQTHRPEAYNKALSSFETGFPGDYISYADYLEKSPPYFINSSMGWRNSEDIYEVFQALSPPALVVTASGNNFPKGLESIKSKASENFGAIVVGSFSSGGFASSFSVSGKEVKILAPSDRLITSAGESGEYDKFGGTSGAAPLVTGSLAGFEWLSGYHPTAEEVKILLEKTAFPTLNTHEEPQINGVGLVNAYKMGEVGKKLKEKCKNKGASCFKVEILNDENYRFDVNKLDENLERDLNQTFPDCAMEKNPAISQERSNCKKKEDIYLRLRKAILLDPKKSKDLLKSLSCIYKEGGFLQNAIGLDKLQLALGSKEEVRAFVRASAKKEEPISDEIFRLMLGMGGFEEEFRLFEQRRAVKIAGGMGERSLPLLKRAFKTDNLGLQKSAVNAAGYIGEPGLLLLEQAFDTGDPYLQRYVMESAGNIGEPALPLIVKAFHTGKENVPSFAVEAAGEIGESGLPLLEQAFDTGNPDLQVPAIFALRHVGEPGLPLLERALDTGNPDLQKWVMRSAGGVGESALYLVERAYHTDDFHVQMAALEAAGKIGEPGLPLLEQAFKTDNLGLQRGAVNAAGLMGKPAFHIVEQAFTDFNLQTYAVDAAFKVGRLGLPLLKRMSEDQNLRKKFRRDIKRRIREFEEEEAG